MHWVHLLSCNCGFDSRREHQFEAVMIEKVIAAFLYLGWIFPPESGDCDIGKRVTSMIEFGGINEWYGDVITEKK